MSKVIFEFDKDEDTSDIYVIANRERLINALDELTDLQRKIWKIDYKDTLLISDKKTIIENEALVDDKYFEAEWYINQDLILNDITKITSKISDILEKAIQ